jgi:PAS domain S-box-containing protein
MDDTKKTKEQLLHELIALRERIAVMASMGEKLRRTERALQECENRYRDLVENADIAILIDDREGKFTYFNDKFLELFGFSCEEMRKKSIKTLVHPDDVQRVMECHRARMHGDQVPSRYEFRGIRKNGTTVYLEVDAVPLKMGDRIEGSRSYIWDIAARKQLEKQLHEAQKEAERKVEVRTLELRKSNEELREEIKERVIIEEALRESETRYKALFERSLLCVYISDLEGNILDANDASLNLLGCMRDDLPEITLANLVTEDQRAELQKTITHIMTRGASSSPHEWKLRRKNGEYVWVEAETAVLYHEGKPYALQVTARDITERKRALELLKKSEEEKAIILDSMLEHVTYHAPDFKIIWANKAAAKSAMKFCMIGKTFARCVRLKSRLKRASLSPAR